MNLPDQIVLTRNRVVRNFATGPEKNSQFPRRIEDLQTGRTDGDGGGERRGRTSSRCWRNPRPGRKIGKGRRDLTVNELNRDDYCRRWTS